VVDGDIFADTPAERARKGWRSCMSQYVEVASVVIEHEG
jgi:hypothetical protein